VNPFSRVRVIAPLESSAGGEPRSADLFSFFDPPASDKAVRPTVGFLRMNFDNCA
jgi:hypothetical protein